MSNILITVPKLSSSGGVSNFWNSLFSAFESFKDINFEVLEIGGHGKNILGPLKDQFRFHNKLKKDINLAFLNPSLLSKSFFRDGLFAKQLVRNNQDFVVFFHGWDLSFQEKVTRKYQRFFQNTFGQAKKIFVLSSEFELQLLKWGYKGDIIVQVTTVDASLASNFSLDKKISKQDLSQQIKILFLSRIVREKGVFELIEAFKLLEKKMNNLKLLIAGDGEDFETLKHRVCNERNIELFGNVEGAKKIKLFEESDIFVLPSYSEGLPIAVLEAMLFALPVITTRVGGLKSFIQEGEMGYLIEPKNIEEIEEKLELLLNENRIQKISKFNHAYAHKHLINNVVAKKIHIHLEGLLK